MPPRGEGIWTSLSQQQFLCFPRVNRQPKKRKPREKTRKRATWREEENRKNLHQVCPAPNLMIATTSNVNRASTDQATAPNPSRRSNGPGVDGGPPHQATPWTWSCRHGHIPSQSVLDNLSPRSKSHCPHPRRTGLGLGWVAASCQTLDCVSALVHT